MVQIPSALSSIVNSLRGVDRSTSSFRQAANDNSKNMNKIVKDVVTMTSSQRRDLNNLRNSIDDVADSNKQNASRISSTNSLLEQSISLQKDMLAELRVMKRVFLQAGGGGLQTSGAIAAGAGGGAAIGGGGFGSKVMDYLKKNLSAAGGLGLAGLGAKEILGGAENRFNAPTMNGFGGNNDGAPGGSRSSGLKMSDSSKRTVADLVKLARDAGFNEREAPIMAAIAMGESTGNPKAFNPKGRDLSYGLWQINMLGNMGPERRRQFGIQYNDELFDPKVNAKAAYQIYKQQGFRAWTVYSNNSYQKWLPAAMQAAQSGTSQQSQPPQPPPQQSQSNQAASGAAAQSTASTAADVINNAAQRSAAPTGVPGSNQDQSSSSAGATPTRSGSEKQDKDDASRVGGSGAIPSNNIVALGKYLQQQGIRVSEHPEFGGVGKHVPGSAHYSGRAIDINIGHGINEASHPEHSRRFDRLAAQLREAGYKVIWKQPGHFGHMHVQTGGGQGRMYQGAAEGEGETRGMRAGVSPMSNPMGNAMNEVGMALNQLNSMGMMGGRGFAGSTNPMNALLGGSMGMGGFGAPVFGMGMPGFGGPIGAGINLAGGLLGIFNSVMGNNNQYASMEERQQIRPQQIRAEQRSPFEDVNVPPPPRRPQNLTPPTPVPTPAPPAASEIQRAQIESETRSVSSTKPIEPQQYNTAAMGPQYAGYNDPIRDYENMFDSWVKEISSEGKMKFQAPKSYIA